MQEVDPTLPRFGTDLIQDRSEAQTAPHSSGVTVGGASLKCHILCALGSIKRTFPIANEAMNWQVLSRLFYSNSAPLKSR